MYYKYCVTLSIRNSTRTSPAECGSVFGPREPTPILCNAPVSFTVPDTWHDLHGARSLKLDAGSRRMEGRFRLCPCTLFSECLLINRHWARLLRVGAHLNGLFYIFLFKTFPMA